MIARVFAQRMIARDDHRCACGRHEAASAAICDRSDYTRHERGMCVKIGGRVQAHEAKRARAFGLAVGDIVPSRRLRLPEVSA